ncbi:hypothetical protein HTS88_21415 [Pseudarthrobacter oxydans]|uniref:hypothetical protein n=1 Tax=Pseudarthrobacter oxydans TaxID=1671 RepID=UPI00157284C7|nr:hypothetical protein [Pseudarthrobacter oxydans]NSX38937.1 hypothetical protein [Pseudarthrobacter oxydans]
MKAELPGRFWPAIGDDVWDRIRSEFGLPSLEDVTRRFQASSDQPLPSFVRVFIGEGTFCPGFQFQDGDPVPAVLRLFDAALELKVPHNVFAAWMVTPVRASGTARPIDVLDRVPELERELAAFADRHRPVPAKR